MRSRAFLLALSFAGILAFARETPAHVIPFEAFDLTNQANALDVNAVSGPEFGTPIAYFPGREIQIGVRHLFGR